MIRSYRELCQLETFDERFEYLKLSGRIGESTFGFERYLNQVFYQSDAWKSTRSKIIIRDNCCDLAIPDRGIYFRVMVHHINPITVDDVEHGRDCCLDPDNLVCVSPLTHNAIHYGSTSDLAKLPKERSRGDMCPWLT